MFPSRNSIRFVVAQLFWMLFLAAPCRGQTAASGNPPRVLFLGHAGNETSDAALFTAIRAQLTVASLTTERVAPIDSGDSMSSRRMTAPRLAKEYGADLVFWIEDEDPCQIHFFVPDDTGGKFSSRTIDVNSSSQSSRYDVIAVVAAIMIEGLVTTHPPAPKTPREAQAPPVKKVKKKGTPRRFEIHAAYTGSLMAAEMLSHGGTLGLGVLPLRRLFVSVSFSLFAPTSFSNETLRLRFISRQLQVDAAARMLPAPFEIRLGVSYCADFRSFSATALDDTIRSRGDGFNAVHSFVPFLSAAWIYRDRIGIFGKVGAGLAVNESVYRIRRADGEFTEELEPFDAKLVYQFGLLIRL